MTPRYDVFLSHSTADKAAVETLAQKLLATGINPFLDKWHLVPGEPWQEALEDALDQSRTCAVFVGPSGLGPWQNEEMRAALDERVHNQKLRVIPVLLPGVLDSQREKLPRFLRRLAWVDFHGGLEDEKAFRLLVHGIEGTRPGPGGSGVGGPVSTAVQGTEGFGSADVATATPRSSRFQVALSFAGEQRWIVSQVAGKLAAALGRDQIFYDKYHEAELARPDLDLHLQQIYLDSGLLVVFLSADYERKEWCGLEWRVVRDLIKRKSSDQIMLIRFDDAPISGLLGIDGFINIKGRKPGEIADLILERLRSPRRNQAAGQPRPKWYRRFWLVGLLLALVCLGFVGWKIFLWRQSHVLLLLPARGIFEYLPPVDPLRPRPHDLVCSLRVRFMAAELPIIRDDLRQQPIYLGAQDRLGWVTDGTSSSTWIKEVEAWSRKTLTEGEKGVLIALADKKSRLVKTPRLKEGGKIVTELICARDGHQIMKSVESFTIDTRHDVQPVFLRQSATDSQGEAP
jgi:hypothetical protein